MNRFSGSHRRDVINVDFLAQLEELSLAQMIAEAHVRYPGFTRYHFDDGPWVGERRVAFTDRLDDAASAWMFSRMCVVNKYVANPAIDLVFSKLILGREEMIDFKGSHFEAGIILVRVRRYLAYPFGVGLILMGLIVTPALAEPWSLPRVTPSTYTNPLPVDIPGDGMVESCADPSIIRGQQLSDPYWYIYCTSDPLNEEDRTGEDFNFHLIPILRSLDLVHWTYIGDAFEARPDWVADNAGLWAPNIEYFNGQYYLYYTASQTDLPGGGSAIGVATSASPAGPWLDSGTPVVEPHEAPCCPGAPRWVFDPDVIQVKGKRYIYYGSYFGGVSVRVLSPDGLTSDPSSQIQIAIPNRYEGVRVIKRGRFFYLFASATDCCKGPLTGYSEFVGRSISPLGPFVDRQGVSFLDARVGGLPVLSMNGNHWVGPGHTAMFRDFDGQDWAVYQAVDRFDPYFEGAPGFTKRPVLMDPLDWVDGWPTVRGGRWASVSPQHAPAAQLGQETNYRVKLAKEDVAGRLIRRLSDDFDGEALSSQWGWVRPPDPGAYEVGGGTFRFETQPAELHVDANNASVLTEPAPHGNYVVETRVHLDLPSEGCCYNYVQAGLVIYGDDDNYLKLAHASFWETRQTEFAKERAPVPPDYPRYGNTVVGPPDEWTYLRIVKRTRRGKERYRAYTSRDGLHWVRGGVWTHRLGSEALIGLVALGGEGFTARFDYVRVFTLL
jgi:arabinan endo-1,5-alpha-L-arabinosidase